YSTTDTRGVQYAGGIAGYSYGKIDNCYALGDLYATNYAGGIVGYLDGANAEVNNCFAINNKIDVSDQSGVAMRVIGGFKNGAQTPQSNNYALKTMVVSVNNVTQIIYDDPLEGISLYNNSLMQQSTYATQGWDFTNVWGIDEGEGYPYLLALVEEETPDIIAGDVNGDNTVNVSDYVTTASYILEQNPQPFVFAAADLDSNGTVNVADLVGVASIALTFEGAPRRAPMVGNPLQQGAVILDALMINHDNNGYQITIDMDNNVDISALQMDIDLPCGMTLVDASLTSRASNSHQVAFSETQSGNYRLLASSPSCRAFKDNEGAVLTLTLAGEPTGSITLSDIVFATPSASAYNHDGILLNPIMTGVNIINGNEAKIYSNGGNIIIESPASTVAQLIGINGVSSIVKVKEGRNVIPTPSKGVMIVKVNDKAVKLVF
ncbi:MAG: dockerin type I repeat-containing protein, partial [Muribaculaceae bacterium]|nr:dockerin type I repeat-containing protein [Muribaculaceae bacterium]